jgi:predicted dehydrogenase
MGMKKYKVGFIGTGARAIVYARAYSQNEEIEVAALCSPEKMHRQLLKEKAGLENTFNEYDDYIEMLKKEQLDGVVIASPNHLHAEHTCECIKAGLSIALEKPLEVTMPRCESIADAEAEHNARILIGFVLRKAPFYAKIKELFAAEKIGRVISIQADELPGFGVTSTLLRSSWRKHVSTSGGVMLEKSCHDMDIFNWLLESRPVSLNCYGGKNIFNENFLLPDNCENCGHAKECNYFMRSKLSDHEHVDEGLMHSFIEGAECIFNSKSNIADVQSVNIEYENSAVVNFMLTLNCSGPKSNRNFHAVGTLGRIWGNVHESKLFWHDNLSDKTTEFDCSGDGSGHGGGDKMHALELLKMMKDPDYYPDQNAQAGYLSAAMCFAADKSMNKNRRVYFNYENNNRIVLQ